MFYILQDRLINLKTKTGQIYNRVHYVKYKKPTRQGKKTKSGQLENNNDDGHEDDAIDEVAFLLFFKTCIVERDLDELKKRLEQSIDMRHNLIKRKDTEFHKVFPFYFVEPSLVSIFSKKLAKLKRMYKAFFFQISFDFEIRYKAIDTNTFFNKWPAIKKNVIAAVNASSRDSLLTYFDENIGFYLCLLKLLVPATANLPNCISKFVIFSDVSSKCEITHHLLN